MVEALVKEAQKYTGEDKTGAFSLDEDAMLLVGRFIFGNRWQNVEKTVPGRSVAVGLPGTRGYVTGRAPASYPAFLTRTSSHHKALTGATYSDANDYNRRSCVQCCLSPYRGVAVSTGSHTQR